MIEILGVIASVIAVATAIFAVRKRLFPSKVVSSESLTKAKANFDYYFSQWRETDYGTKHKHLIPWDGFKEIGRHRKEFRSIEKEEARLFLFVCAVKHGLWGDWWPGDVNKKSAILALAALLNGRAGWRPVWRAAYLIEKLSNEDSRDWTNDLPIGLSDDANVQETVRIMKDTGAVKHLELVSQGNNSHLRDKAFTILEDIKAYTGDEVQLQYPDPLST